MLEAAPLNAAELAAYCRRKGLLVEQLERWRTEVHTALPTGQNRAGASERAMDKKRIGELGRDLRRKEKALAETAALLVNVPKVRSAEDRRRGRMIALPQRQELVADIEPARQAGAPIGSSCAEPSRRALAPPEPYHS